MALADLTEMFQGLVISAKTEMNRNKVELETFHRSSDLSNLPFEDVPMALLWQSDRTEKRDGTNRIALRLLCERGIETVSASVTIELKRF